MNKYFFPSCDAHAIALFIESKILLFCKVANLMHNISKGLAPLFIMIRSLFTWSNEIHGYNTRHAVKGNYFRKVIKLKNFKHSFSGTRAIL